MTERKQKTSFLREIAATLLLAAALVGIFFLAARPPHDNLSSGLTRTVLYGFNRTSGVAFAALAALEKVLPLQIFKAEKLSGEDEGRVNVLILGRTGPGHIAPDLTDTLMVLSLPVRQAGVDARPPEAGEHRTPHFFLIGIPRDLLVKIPGTENITKINALYAIKVKSQKLKVKSSDFVEETELIRKAVEEITGLPIHHTAIINVAALRDLVGAFGGVDVYVEKNIYDPAYPTPGGGIMRFELPEGWQHLDAVKAEKYARTRHDRDGDFGRIRRQIKMLEALETTAQSLNWISDFPKLLEIYNVLSQNIQTDLSLGEIRRLWEIGQDFIVDDLSYLVLDTRSENPLLSGGLVPLGSTLASSLWPKAGMFEYSEIRQRINANIDANARE